uniref:Uncharacterized protein n=1 Tax=Tetranychus urticae TaxID=32264 RepID=T1KMW1_TETUR
MEQHNDNSDKTTFKVDFLGECHEVVIDWNDDKYKYKYKRFQLFELLESITGVPRELNMGIILYQAENRQPRYHTISIFYISDYPNDEEICDSIRDAGRFRLTFGATYDFKQPSIFYALVPESSEPGGGCSFHFCRYKHTKSFFNKVKDIITNEKLNAKIASAIQSLRDDGDYVEVLRQFNVLQYFRSMCDYHYTRRIVNEDQRLVSGRKHPYLRTRERFAQFYDIIRVKMEQQNDNSDKTTFKVDFLGEYHDVVIDWNDDKYKLKGIQLFEQLESITGVPREFNSHMFLQYHQVEDEEPLYHFIYSHGDSNISPNKEEICDSIRNAEGRFHLAYQANYGFKGSSICYVLVPESSVPEGECSFHFCRYINTKRFFNKVKDIITNEKLNAKIASAIQASRDPANENDILRQFDVLKYFHSMCDDLYTRQYMHGDEQLRPTFKVEFLGEYHDLVIDWNDDKYIYKARQLFKQLESITGVPCKFNPEILLHHFQVEDETPHYYNIYSFVENAEGRFHLAYNAVYPHIGYFLVPESSVPEGECSFYFCRHKNTKSFFNKLKDIITNDELNAKIASAFQSRESNFDEILRQFDVLKYFRSICDDLYTRRFVNEEERRIFCQRNLYLRTRG